MSSAATASTTARSSRATGERAERMRRRRRGLLLNLGSFGFMLLAWTALTELGVVGPLFLPSPMKLIETFGSLSQGGYQGYSIWHHIGMSLQRFGIAFLITVVVAIPIGLLMGLNENVRSILDPPIEITRPMPKLALIPILIIWLGIGETPKVVIIILGIFAILSIASMQGVKSVGFRKVQAASSLGANSWQVFYRVIFPGALPEIFTGLRQAVGVGVTMLVGAEMIATVDGVAFMALSAANYLLTSVTLVGVLVMAILGYGLDSVIRAVEERVVHWRGKEG